MFYSHHITSGNKCICLVIFFICYGFTVTRSSCNHHTYILVHTYILFELCCIWVPPKFLHTIRALSHMGAPGVLVSFLSFLFFIRLKVNSSHNRVLLSLMNTFHIIIYIAGTISLLISFTLQWKQVNHTYRAYQCTIFTLISSIKHHLIINFSHTIHICSNINSNHIL